MKRKVEYVLLQDKAEWRTLGLIVACYLCSGLLIMNPMALPLWLQMLAFIPLVTLHSSLQHECMHAHPFKSTALNDAVICFPLGAFISYFRFKAAHITHHRDCRLADPYEDPESWYQDPQAWANKQPWLQRIFELNNTLVGRMLLGPAISIVGFADYEIKNGGWKVLFIWLGHYGAVGLTCFAIMQWADMPVWAYLVCCYFGYSLLMIRTYLEHQAHESIRERTVIIEDKGFFSYLFLNNNLHVVHHAYPKLAWYQLPTFFQRNRKHFLAMNKGYYFSSYLEIFKRFAFSRKEPVAYPINRASSLEGVSSDG